MGFVFSSSVNQLRFLALPLTIALVFPVPNARKASPVFETLLYRSTVETLASSISNNNVQKLTCWYHNPNKVHEEVVAPKVIRFRPAIIKALVVEVEHAGSIIEDVAVELTEGDHCL